MATIFSLIIELCSKPPTKDPSYGLLIESYEETFRPLSSFLVNPPLSQRVVKEILLHPDTKAFSSLIALLDFTDGNQVGFDAIPELNRQQMSRRIFKSKV